MAMKRILLLFLLFTGSCAMPRIIVLEDPLSAREHNDLGVAYEQKRMFSLAEKEYARAIEKEKDWAIPRFNLGNLYYAQGNLKLAERSYRAALDMDRNNPDIMNNLAVLLHETKRDDEAKELILKALAIRSKEEYRDTYQKITGSAAP
jgi:Flp pilus assembly protein TadD